MASATFQVSGNWGTLVCDSATGAVLEYDRTDSDWEKPGDGYDDIVRLDVDEWHKTYPGADLAECAADILDFGSWDTAGRYCGPEKEWRFGLWADRPAIESELSAADRAELAEWLKVNQWARGWRLRPLLAPGSIRPDPD